MAEKKSFALRIDAETMKAMEKWASDEFRSVNGQIEWLMHRALREAGRIRREPDADAGGNVEARPEAPPENNAGPQGDKGPPD